MSGERELNSPSRVCSPRRSRNIATLRSGQRESNPRFQPGKLTSFHLDHGRKGRRKSRRRLVRLRVDVVPPAFGPERVEGVEPSCPGWKPGASPRRRYPHGAPTGTRNRLSCIPNRCVAVSTLGALASPEGFEPSSPQVEAAVPVHVGVGDLWSAHEELNLDLLDISQACRPPILCAVRSDRAESHRLTPGSQPGPSTASGSISMS